MNGLYPSTVNLIRINWSKGAAGCYRAASMRVEEIGAYVGYFIKNVILHHTTEDKIQLIGHNLGAHSAGFGTKNETYIVLYVIC